MQSTLAAKRKPKRMLELINTNHQRIKQRMPQKTDEQTLEELAELTLLHRDMDIAIQSLMENAYNDQLQLTRLKKRKLRLKEQIEKLKSSLIPDMPA